MTSIGQAGLLVLVGVLLLSTTRGTPLDYVDTYIGTGGHGYGVGGVPVGVQSPFGMVRLSPDGTPPADIWAPWDHTGGYHYGDTEIRYFSHLHMQGAGTMDYGNIGVMPDSKVPTHFALKELGMKQKFSHDNETASAGYYQVYFPDGEINAEASLELPMQMGGVPLPVLKKCAQITATKHVGMHRYTFMEGKKPSVVLFDVSAAMKLRPAGCTAATVSIDLEAKDGPVVWGQMHNVGDYSGRFGGFEVYFVARLNQRPLKYGVWNDTQMYHGSLGPISGVKPVGAYLEFESSSTVEVAVGISFISVDQAMANLNAEVPVGDSFDTVLENVQSDWTDALSRVTVNDDNASHSNLTVFYTAVYHSLCAPTLFSEVGGMYLGFDGKVHTIASDSEGYYTDLSIWDVFRTQMPFLGFVFPTVMRDIARSLVLMYQQGGDLPRWPLANGYTNGMMGTHADIVLADAFTKGLDFDYETAYQGMYQGATQSQANAGRSDIEFYLANGYVPLNGSQSGCSDTLAYAYDDWSISVMAKGLNKTDDFRTFSERGQNYRTQFNPNIGNGGFMCPKDGNGTFQCPHHLIYTFKDYVEGDAWQWRWFAPQDPVGLASLFPSTDTFVAELSTFFELSFDHPRHIFPNPYYWAGNEPDIFAAYLFAFVGRPDLTQEYSRKVLMTAFSDQPDGIPGNDDYGAMSAWAVWTSIGLYPQAGNTTLILGSPLFSNVTILRDEGNVSILAQGASPSSPYVQTVSLNGSTLSSPLIDYRAIKNGAVLELVMGDNPLPDSQQGN